MHGSTRPFHADDSMKLADWRSITLAPQWCNPKADTAGCHATTWALVTLCIMPITWSRLHVHEWNQPTRAHVLMCYALSLILVLCSHYAAYLSLPSSFVPPDCWLPSTGLTSDFAAISILSSLVHFPSTMLTFLFRTYCSRIIWLSTVWVTSSICGTRASFLQLLPHSLYYLLSTLLRISQLISKWSADRLQL